VTTSLIKIKKGEIVKTITTDSNTIVLGIDVGKTKHHAYAIDSNKKVLYNKPLVQDEKAICDLFNKLKEMGEVILVVDQPRSIGDLCIKLAHACNITPSFITPYAMRKGAQLLGFNAKTDQIDAKCIALLAYMMPENIRVVAPENEKYVNTRILLGATQDLQDDKARHINRLRSNLFALSPAFERLFPSNSIDYIYSLEILSTFGGPEPIRKKGKKGFLAWAKKKGLRNKESITERVFTAISEQTLIPPSHEKIETLVRNTARKIIIINKEKDIMEQQIEEILSGEKTYESLTSIPFVGPKTGATIVAEIGDGSNFKTGDELASYAGLAPKVKQSGTSINGISSSRGGNKRLKNALFQVAFNEACSPNGSMKEYYQARRDEGRSHKQIIKSIARKKVKLIFAILRDGKKYEVGYENKSGNKAALKKAA
jgi:transposase